MAPPGRRSLRLLVTLLPLLVSELSAQDTIQYHDHLPSAGKIHGQAVATPRFHLYDGGNPTGLNTEHAATLRRLAARFSPWLHVANAAVPRHLGEAIEEGPHGASLVVDTWYIDAAAEKRNESSEIPVWNVFGVPSASTEPIELTDHRCDDGHSAGTNEEMIIDVIGCVGPYRGPSRPVAAEGETDRVLYFDFPGTGEESWRREHLETERNVRPHIYAHPFVKEEPFATGSGREARYRFVIQYWFFYPFNDFVNNHEGDWEHVNVHVTTPQHLDESGRGAGLLTGGEVEAILAGEGLEALRISRLDYYFHHNVMILDLLDLGVYQEADGESSGVSGTYNTYLGTGWEVIQEDLRERHGPGAPAPTHPVGYVSGAPLAWTLLVTKPTSGNRDSHGTYPFEGVWKRVGPAFITETVRGRPDPCSPELDPDCDEGWLQFGEDDITVVPDWEVFFDGCPAAGTARCYLRPTGLGWFWTYLPIRWGYPIAASFGGGLIPRFNLGQAAPMGPTYQAGWNRTGQVEGFHAYEAHVRKAGSTAPTDFYLPGFGFFNHLIQAAVLLPNPLLPMSILLSELNPPIFSPLTHAPVRGISVALEAGHRVGNRRVEQVMPFFSGTDAVDQDWGRFGRIALRYHLSRWAIGAALSEDELIRGDHAVRRHMLSGFHTLTPSHGRFKPYVKAGYGWSSWSVDDSPTNLSDFLPDRWPDDWLVGAGAEFLVLSSLPRGWFPVGPGMEVGLQLEWTQRWSRIPDWEALQLLGDPHTLKTGRWSLSVTFGR